MTAGPRRRYGILLACGIAAASPASVGALPMARSASACAVHADEAAARSRLSASLILRVMHVESRGRANAISPKGAMGCMQIMPATWRELTRRHGLGGDPWDPRFNMIGGALYLADMIARFGLPGAYAAYNAGPARYARYRAGRAALPRETIAYMASLDGSAGALALRARADADRGAARRPPRWQDAGLFGLDQADAIAAEAPPTSMESAPDAGAIVSPRTAALPSPRAPHADRRAPVAALFPLEGAGTTPRRAGEKTTE